MQYLNHRPSRRARVVAASLAVSGVVAVAFSVVLSVAPAAVAVPPAKGEGAAETVGEGGFNYVAPASDEAAEAISRVKLPAGFKAELFAAEPRLANPVAFHIDEKNRFYVVETFRRKVAVIDVRNVMHWLDDDLASRTVAARNAMVKKFVTQASDLAQMTGPSERLRLIEDRDGDGAADFDSVFSAKHNRLEDGIAAGVLARNGDVYFANVPSLWRLRDENGDGREDVRDELHYGYGVRYAFVGHDLHGLRFGPDGKLYFSIGDRGLHVEKTPDDRTVSNPDSGAVLRCNPDGTELELVHTGLRNPQELAFDEFGNLFTGDNNSDGGDKARWVYVVEGGDSGWRIGYQHQEFPVSRGPWNHEGIWMDKPVFPAFYHVPPVIELQASGPSGLTYDTGTGLPEEFQGRFFLADFRGGPGNSSVFALKHQPKGAGFEMVEQKPLVGNLLVTDVEVGYDGIYVSDWTDGWLTTGKGRLYRLFHEQATKDPAVADTRKLMSEGMAKREPGELAKLLAHRDQRVRQAAQFELAGRGEASTKLLAGAARQTDDRLARLHGIWGLGQLGRQNPGALDQLLPLLADADEEVRAQAAKVLGDARFERAYEPLVKRLADDAPRVRFFAALAVGKLGRPEAVSAVIAMLRENDDRDAYLRHAGVMALVHLGDVDAIRQVAKVESAAVRMAALLAMRRTFSPDVAMFLDDPDPRLVLEAARAINDVPIEGATGPLADLIDRPDLPEPVMTRVLNANLRAGSADAAAALAGFARREGGKETFRVEALRMLGTWGEPLGRDRVTGVWRPMQARDPAVARAAVAPLLPEIMRAAPDAFRVAAAGLVTKIGIDDPALLSELALNAELGGEVRAAALGALANRKGAADERLVKVVDAAMSDANEAVRAAGVRAAGKLTDATDRLGAVLQTGSPREQQAALATLAALPGKEVDALIVERIDLMLAGDSAGRPVAKEVRLDVLDAAAARKDPRVAAKLEQYAGDGDASHPLAPFRETLFGGAAAAGERIFRERADVSCLRCHAVGGEGGNAGPDLAGIGSRQQRDYILESIVAPNKVISPGFETVTVRLRDGTIHAGLVKADDEKRLQLDVPDKGIVTLDKARIRQRKGGQSAMPDNIAQTLTKQDVRNLVEYLSTLK